MNYNYNKYKCFLKTARDRNEQRSLNLLLKVKIKTTIKIDS